MACQSFKLISNQQIICDQFKAGIGKVRGVKETGGLLRPGEGV